MSKLSLLTIIAIAPTLSSAASIAGKVALGTWNTQAEFADLKVVKGSQTLYQSNFAAGSSGVTFSGGTWSTANGYLRQTGNTTPALAIVGNTAWSDYTVTVRARKTGGAEGFLIGFGMPDNATNSWWNIGGWGNTQGALQAPGFSMQTKAGSIQTNRWYTIRIEVQGSDARFYLDGVKVYDTMRLLGDDEWTDRANQVLNSTGLATLPGWEQDQVRELLGRSIYRGGAARARFDSMPGKTAFLALNASDQAAIVRKINRNRVTWNFGWHENPNDTGKINTVADSMDGATALYNALGVFDKQLWVQTIPASWTTADANYDGQIRFGSQTNYRTALHEISHALGTGTIWQWNNFMVNGAWTGTYTNLQLQQFDGAGAVMYGNSQHYWPYGQNYDNELNAVSERRTVQIVTAFRRDMGISGVRDTVYATDVANGTYRLTPRSALDSALEVPNGNNGAPLSIRTYAGTAGQKFYLEKQADGTYVFRTTLASGRSLDLPNGAADNEAQIQLWDTNGQDAQRWYLVPMGDGFYKIAPKNNVWKTLDLWGGSSADGTVVKLWDFADGFHQQFRLDKLG